MRVLARSTLEAFWRQPRYKTSEPQLKAWYADALKAKWSTPQDIKDQYANASVIGNNRVVFNIKGNDYRLIVSIAYRQAMVFVKFIGTHAEYDKIDAETVDMEQT
jgi:mRNA interferase HigB